MKRKTMKTMMNTTMKFFVAAPLLLSTSIFAASGEDETYTNLTLEERLYLFDGYGTNWGVDVGSDGLWFVPERPISETYNAPFKVRNQASSNALVVGSSQSGKEGNIGIGTETPNEAVDVAREGSAARFQLTSISSNSSEVAQFVQRRARAGSTAVQTNDNLGQFSFRGYNGKGFTGTRAGIAVLSAQPWSQGKEGTRMIFTVTKNNTRQAMHGLRIENNGDVEIPNGNLLVKGNQINYPDYVFKKDYDLMPLENLQTYIETHHHLPGIESAEEVGEKGMVNISGLNMKLLEKVEELTLYTLQQEKELKLMRDKYAELEEKLKATK